MAEKNSEEASPGLKHTGTATQRPFHGPSRKQTVRPEGLHRHPEREPCRDKIKGISSPLEPMEAKNIGQACSVKAGNGRFSLGLERPSLGAENQEIQRESSRWAFRKSADVSVSWQLGWRYQEGQEVSSAVL